MSETHFYCITTALTKSAISRRHYIPHGRIAARVFRLSFFDRPRTFPTAGQSSATPTVLLRLPHNLVLHKFDGPITLSPHILPRGLGQVRGDDPRDRCGRASPRDQCLFIQTVLFDQ
jgi:hypothetical protein